MIVILEPEPAEPCGIVISNIAFELVPLFVTTADEPAAPVVIVPTVIVAANPGAPVPAGPVGPVRP